MNLKIVEYSPWQCESFFCHTALMNRIFIEMELVLSKAIAWVTRATKQGGEIKSPLEDLGEVASKRRCQGNRPGIRLKAVAFDNG